MDKLSRLCPEMAMEVIEHLDWYSMRALGRVSRYFWSLINGESRALLLRRHLYRHLTGGAGHFALLAFQLRLHATGTTHGRTPNRWCAMSLGELMEEWRRRLDDPAPLTLARDFPASMACVEAS